MINSSCSVTKSCLTLCNLMDYSTRASLSFTISQSLLRLMSTESGMPSKHLVLCCPLPRLPSIFPSIRVFSNESSLLIRWPKYWSFSFSISPSNKYSGLISQIEDHIQYNKAREVDKLYKNQKQKCKTVLRAGMIVFIKNL